MKLFSLKKGGRVVANGCALAETSIAIHWFNNELSEFYDDWSFAADYEIYEHESNRFSDMDVLQRKFDLVHSAPDFLPIDWLAKNILGFTDEEIKGFGVAT